MVALATENVHPAIRPEIDLIDEMIQNPRGILRDYPEAQLALSAQRDFIANRPQIVAYNSINGSQSVYRLMRVEGVEFVEAALQAISSREKVNGSVSSEADDWVIFLAQYAASLGMEGTNVGLLGRAEIALGMATLRFMTKIFPDFKYLESLPAKVEENGNNWPVRPLQARPDWSKATIAQFHHDYGRKDLKQLRSQMPGGKTVLDPIVHDALETYQRTPPMLDSAGPDYVLNYLRVVADMDIIFSE